MRANGMKINLKENAVPRMFYRDQISRHVKAAEAARAPADKLGLQFHTNPEECDYVIELEDAYYDIALIKDKNGYLVPFFDDYNYPSQSSGTKATKPIRGVLGAKYEGKVEHWSGERDATDQTLHSVGKLLQGYARHAAMEAATMAGYQVLGYEEDDKGWQHLLVEVN